MNERIVCQKCIYYFVTWQKGRSHGCKAYGFKTQDIPSSVVKRTSGRNCVFYVKKNNTK